MLIRPSLTSFLVGLVFCVHVIAGADASKAPSKSKSKRSSEADAAEELKTLSALIQDAPLPVAPATLNQEMLIYIKRGLIRDLMKKIFPQYADVQDEITRLIAEIREDEKKYDDEGVKQKLLSLSREQSVFEQAEMNLVTLATKALVVKLHGQLDQQESKAQPLVFAVRIIDEEREHFPSFTKWPEIKSYQENLSKQFLNEFLRVYIEIREKETERKQTKTRRSKRKPGSNQK